VPCSETLSRKKGKQESKKGRKEGIETERKS
jgi:hypothetical protein